MINTTMNRKIQQLLTNNIPVVSLDGARKLATALELTLTDCLTGVINLIFSVDTINGSAMIILRDLEEVDRLLEAILDFNDRLQADLVERDSVQLIDLVSSINPRTRETNSFTLALIGDWNPVFVPRPSTEAIPCLDDEDSELLEHAPIRFLNVASESALEQSDNISNNFGPELSDLRNQLSQPVQRWLPSFEAIQRVEALRDEIPHMGEFLEEVLNTMRMAERFKANRFTLPPMILKGPPGVGKTHSLFALSEALGLTMHNIPMSSLGAGFALTGMERGWRDPEPGLLAKAAAKSKHINPIIILDEFEKAIFRKGDNVAGLEPALLQMLEKDSARRFYDLYLEEEINLSEVSYIGSANSTDLIPPAILSRVKVIDVGYPTPESLQQLYSTILNNALKEDYGIDCLTVGVTTNIERERLTDINPRLLRNNAGRILSTVIMTAKPGDHIDVSADELLRLMPSSQNMVSRGMGFMASL